MAGAKRPTGRRKKAARSPSPASRSSPRRQLKKVQSSSAPGAAVAARRLGVSASTLRRWARAGLIRASVDTRGQYHFPAAARPRSAPGARATKKKRLLGYGKKRAALGKKARKKASKKSPPRVERRPASAAPRSPAPKPPAPKRPLPKRPPPAPQPSPRPAKKKKLGPKERARLGKKALTRAKKKRAAKRPAPPPLPPPRKKRPGKKLVRRKKKKVVPSFAPIPEVAERERPSLTEVVRRTREQIAAGEFAPFGVTVQIPTAPTPEQPLTVDEAAQRMGPVMRDYVMARFQWERDMTHDQFWSMKYAFKKTYGVREWRRVFDWIVDEWGLEDFVFDREALRDS